MKLLDAPPTHDIGEEVPLITEKPMNDQLKKFKDYAESEIDELSDRVNKADVDGRWKDTINEAPKKLQPWIKYGIPVVVVFFILVFVFGG